MTMQTSAGASYATHHSLHLRDANDAYIVFEAVRQGLLPLIKRRLTSEERDALCSGNIFVWEEAEHKGGLERWTDGRRWSQSRMKGEYLFYEEKVETTEEERQAKAARRASRNTGNPVLSVASRRQDRPAKPNGLTKQTYSTQVYLPGLQSPRKWHIVAYFLGSDYTHLSVIDNFDYLRRIRIPDGVFFSAKGLIKRSGGSQADGDGDDDHSAGSSMYSGDDLRGQSPAEQFVSKDRLTVGHSRPYSRCDVYAANGHHMTHSASSRVNTHDAGTLPRLSTIAPPNQRGHYAPPSPSSYSNGATNTRLSPARSSPVRYYQPLSPEDRRALSTFKVVL